jgi:hypothetical protein
MKKETAELLVEAAQDQNINATLRRDYSGRGMFGKTTHAVELPRLDQLAAVAACAAVDLVRRIDESDAPEGFTMRDFVEDLRRLRTDNMGLDYIVY